MTDPQVVAIEPKTSGSADVQRLLTFSRGRPQLDPATKLENRGPPPKFFEPGLQQRPRRLELCCR